MVQRIESEPYFKNIISPRVLDILIVFIKMKTYAELV
nr:MAG TPA: hypothetical protein [Caudoviricetes sp.]